MSNAGSFRKGEVKPGQGKHGPPKATVAARTALAAFVDGNAHRLQAWLDAVADGVPEMCDGKPTGDYLVKPDPDRAFTLFQSVVEFSIPKLARTELTGDGGGPIVLQLTELDRRA